MTHLRPLMIAECPPAGGCGPLGALDGDAGMRLARMDAHHKTALYGPAGSVSLEAQRRCLASTLSLFDRENLLSEPDSWDAALARQSWRGGYFQGRVVARRVVLVGRAREAAGLRGLPPLRWLRMGGPGEPAEVCYLPHPSGRDRWYSDLANVRAATAWLAAERGRLEAAERSWSTFGDKPGGGCFAFRAADAGLRWLPAADAAWDDRESIDLAAPHEPRDKVGWALRGEVVDQLCLHLARMPRWSGASDCSVAAHSLRVALVARDLDPRADRLGAVHDLAEALPGVGDSPSPAKRWLQRVSPEFAALHRGADALVRRLCGLDPTPDMEHAVHLADRVAMATERAVYFDDAPSWLGDVRPVAQALLVDPALAQRIRELDRTLTQYDPKYGDATPCASAMVDAARGDFSWAGCEAVDVAARLADLARGCM